MIPRSLATMPLSHRVGLLVVAVLVLIPLAAWVESAAPEVWRERLAIPHIITEPDRHTPQHTAGTYLPPRLLRDTTYTHADNPLILTGTTRVPAGVTLTLEPGVTFVAHEFATLDIVGRLHVRGTPSDPVVFTTNELHPANQLWSGLVFQPDSTGDIAHAVIEYASPGVSCLANTRVTLDTVHVRHTTTGLYTESRACSLSNSRLQSTGHGVIAVGIEPAVINTIITAAREPLQRIQNE